jgi:hypothetical protein
MYVLMEVRLDLRKASAIRSPRGSAEATTGDASLVPSAAADRRCIMAVARAA